MKYRANWLIVPALALSLVACKKKEESKAPEAPVAVETPAHPEAPVAKATGLTAEERAAKLGFVKHLPQETEVVMAFHNGSKTAERLKSTKLWKLIESQTGGDEGGMVPDGGPQPDEEDFEMPEGEQAADAEPEDAPEMAEPMGPAALFGTEFTIALGKSAGEQTGNLLTINRRMGYFQMRALAKAFVASAKSGEFSSMEEAFSNQYGPELMKDLLADPESGIGLFEKMNMPPLYLAFRTKADQRAAAAQQLAALVANLGMMGEMVEPVEVEKAGQKFAGHKISGAKISAAMAKERSEMEEMLEPAEVDKLLAALAKKDIVVLSGTIGDYAVLFFGSSVDDLNFASDIGHSLVASDALTFTDAYASKELAAVIYGQKGAIEKLMAAAGGLSDMAGGLRDGLSGSEGLGDTRDLEALLQMVGERETALRKMITIESLGTVAFFEDGVKIESYGGTDNGAVDWKSPNKLASLGDSPDVVFFANMTSDAAYDEKARAYFEALFETVYAMAMKVSEAKVEDEKMTQFKEGAKLFDSKFRPDLIAMWDAFSGDFGASLGNESALIVDLKGSVPAIPGIPQPVVDQGKFPRISVVAPVTDRAKLAASWQKMNASTTSILAKVSEMAGQDIPMQKPISSEKNGHTTWFFPMPFFNDDFMPSVTVGDQWFAASTSKNQALDLVGKAAAGGETRNGLWISVNFKALQQFSDETLKLLEKNNAAILGENAVTPEQLKNAANLIEAVSELDKLTVHARREGGVLRSSVHFKTR